MRCSNACPPVRRPSWILPALIGALFWWPIDDARAGDVGELTRTGKTALSEGRYEQALASFDEALKSAPDAAAEMRLQFLRAMALQQKARNVTGPEKQRLLEESERLYLDYLAFRPDGTAAVNNLANVYEELGRPEKAMELYERIISAEGENQGLYLQNYAEFLEESGDWNKAAEVYSRLVRELPLSYGQQEALAERYGRRGLDALAGFLWELIDAAGSWQVADIALGAFIEDGEGSDGTRIELLTIVALGMSRAGFDPERYERSGFREDLEALVDDPAIGGGAAELVKLNGIASHILDELGTLEPLEGDVCKAEDQHELLTPGQYPWWRSMLGSTDRDPPRGVWPADGFRSLVQSLGARMRKAANEVGEQDPRSVEYYRFAESFFTLAAELQAGEVDPSAVLELVELKIETDQLLEVQQVRDVYEGEIVENGTSTGSDIQLKKSFSYHKGLGGLYSRLDGPGEISNTETAVDQLELALQRNVTLDNKTPEELPSRYQFTPDMIEMLADGYAKTGESGKIAILRIEQAERYLNAGDACTALDIVGPLREADVPASLRDRYQNLIGAISRDCGSGGVEALAAGEQVRLSSSSDYIGDDIRLAIGYDSETDLTGELFWNFREDCDSAWSFEGWKGNDSSGGLKLNYHWLTGGAASGDGCAGSSPESDPKVRKLFAAADQNVFGDAKLTFGGGGEREDRFWGLYVSKSITGERFLDRTVREDVFEDSYIIDYHRIIESEIVTTTTDFFAHPYDWGIGFRIGRFFDGSLIRLNAGLDYEWGDYSAYQVTGYAGLDKRFMDSSHGLSFRAEVLRKHGDFEIDESDVRLSAYWSWDFGETFRPAAGSGGSTTAGYHASQAVAVEPLDDADEFAIAAERAGGPASEPVQNQVTLKGAGFELDCDQLTEEAKHELRTFFDGLRDTVIVSDIEITGHTCSLGSDEHNQELSEARAEAVSDFLVMLGVPTRFPPPESHAEGKSSRFNCPHETDVGSGQDFPPLVDFPAMILPPKGLGEREPKYSNCSEDTRARNRRVEITFTSEEAVPPAAVAVAAAEAPVIAVAAATAPAEPAWIRRALRNPVAHKRSVDYYRYQRESTRTSSTREVINQGADAADDRFTVDQDSERNVLAVLANDSDPEFDGLEIIEPTAAERTQHGTIESSGGTFLYTPDPGYCGPDSFVYVIEDRFVTEPHDPGDPSEATVTIDVVCNEPPVAVDDEFTVEKYGVRNSLDVLRNDFDPDGDPISIVADSVSAPQNGGSANPGPASIVYTAPEPVVPGAPQNCSDSFTYAIEDDRQNRSNAATVSITVRNDLPMAMDDTDFAPRNAPVTIDVLANDEDDDDLAIVGFTQPSRLRGMVTLNDNGRLTYTPDGRYWGEDIFQYTVRDYCGEESTATVTVTVENKEIPVPSPGPR